MRYTPGMNRVPSLHSRLRQAEANRAAVQQGAAAFAAVMWARTTDKAQRQECERFLASIGCQTPIAEIAQARGLEVAQEKPTEKPVLALVVGGEVRG